MKIKVPLRELTDLDVTWVSLVDRGANRIPFRIIKRDTNKEPTMAGINLSALGLRVKKAAPPPEAVVSAVILAKGDSALADEARKILVAEGLDLPDTKVFEDGSMALHAGADFETGAQVVRLSDTMAVVLKGFDPYSTKLDGMSFGEAAQARGYYDSVRGAMNVLSDMVSTRLYKADSPAAAVGEIQTALSEFQQYVVELTKGLPAAVFKSEERVSSLVSAYAPAEVQKAEETPKEEPPKVEEPVVAVTNVVVEKSADYSKETDEEKAERMAKEQAEKDKMKKAESEAIMAPITSALSAMTDTLSALSKSVGDLSSKVEKIEQSSKSTEEKLAEVQKKAEDATHVLKSTVVGSATSGDPEPTVKVTKGDGDFRTGVFDSALIPRNNRR